METCKTCIHWTKPASDDYESKPICNPTDPDTFSAMVLDYGIRICKSPRLLWFASPGRDEAALIDGSEYYAALITGEDFGCTNHEAQSS